MCVWDLFVVRGRLEGAVVVVVQLGAGVVLHLLQAVNAAALAASAHGGAGDGVITAQTVHLTACLISILCKRPRNRSPSSLKTHIYFND